MAQKSKKQVRKAPAAARPAAEAAVVSGTVAANAAPVISTRSFTTEFNPDYSQTVKDLKRIALLAGSFFVLLVILAFVLP
jgi:hypothetical protein